MALIGDTIIGGMTFEQKKAKKIARIDKRISKVEALKSCSEPHSPKSKIMEE